VQLEWLTSTPWPNSSLSSFSTPSSAIRDKKLSATKISRCRSSWFQQNQEAVNWIPSGSRLPERAQCRQGNMGSTRYHCSMRGQTETAALSVQVNPQAPYIQAPVKCPSLWWFLRYLLPFPNLAHHQPRVASAHLSRTQDNSEGVQQRWRGQWARRVGRVLVGV